jgi:crotonobetainyl-CoA:carnitine CoA-transferase CaiB-like acyl-CoA transferase
MEVLRGLGLTYEKLRAVNPRLVYATNTGYGHAIEVNRPSYDINVQALTGIMTRQGEPGQPPIYLGMGSGDTYGGILSALGILLALYQRNRTGEGQFIDASLYGAQLFMSAPTLQPFLAGQNDFYSNQQSRSEARNPLWNRYEAKDKWLYLCLENTDANWAKLCEGLGQPDLAENARFQTTAQRAEHNTRLIVLLGEAMKQRTAQEWMERWRPLGIAASPIQNLKEVSEDPQAWANDYFLKTHCAEVNREVDIRGLPITLSKTPGRVESLGPELGQDTEILLMEVLEMEWERIEELKAEGVIP